MDGAKRTRVVAPGCAKDVSHQQYCYVEYRLQVKGFSTTIIFDTIIRMNSPLSIPTYSYSVCLNFFILRIYIHVFVMAPPPPDATEAFQFYFYLRHCLALILNRLCHEYSIIILRAKTAALVLDWDSYHTAKHRASL